MPPITVRTLSIYLQTVASAARHATVLESLSISIY